MCAEHVDDAVGAIGGAEPALAVAMGIGGPLRPDLSSCVRVKPGIYLRIASDGLARKLIEGGKSALPLCGAIQAAQMLDMLSPREEVMGLADGELNHFKRSWTYCYAGHLDAPDPGWRYQPLVVIARALNLDSVPATMPAAAVGPVPARDINKKCIFKNQNPNQSTHN